MTEGGATLVVVVLTLLILEFGLGGPRLIMRDPLQQDTVLTLLILEFGRGGKVVYAKFFKAGES